MSERKHIHLPYELDLWQNRDRERRETRRIFRPVGDSGYEAVLSVSEVHATEGAGAPLIEVCDAVCAKLDALLNPV